MPTRARPPQRSPSAAAIASPHLPSRVARMSATQSCAARQNATRLGSRTMAAGSPFAGKTAAAAVPPPPIVVR